MYGRCLTLSRCVHLALTLRQIKCTVNVFITLQNKEKKWMYTYNNNNDEDEKKTRTTRSNRYEQCFMCTFICCRTDRRTSFVTGMIDVERDLIGGKNELRVPTYLPTDVFCLKVLRFYYSTLLLLGFDVIIPFIEHGTFRLNPLVLGGLCFYMYVDSLYPSS